MTEEKDISGFVSLFRKLQDSVNKHFDIFAKDGGESFNNLIVALCLNYLYPEIKEKMDKLDIEAEKQNLNFKDFEQLINTMFQTFLVIFINKFMRICHLFIVLLKPFVLFCGSITFSVLFLNCFGQWAQTLNLFDKNLQVFLKLSHNWCLLVFLITTIIVMFFKTISVFFVRYVENLVWHYSGNQVNSSKLDEYSQKRSNPLDSL